MHLGNIGAMMALNGAGDGKLCLMMTDVRYFLTSRDCLGQFGQSDFEACESWSTGGFALLSGSEAICFLFYATSYTYKHYTMAKTKKLSRCFDWKKCLFWCFSFLSNIDTYSMEDVAGRARKVYSNPLTSSSRART